MAISKSELTTILEEHFPDSSIELEDHFGDGEKYQLNIQSPQFSGLNRVQQHQLVMKALKTTLETKLHAISIKTSQK